jgi:hypothetical protein
MPVISDFVSCGSVGILTPLLATRSTRPGCTPGRSKRCRSPLLWASPVHWVLRALSVGVYSWWDMKLAISAKMDVWNYTTYFRSPSMYLFSIALITHRDNFTIYI